MNRSSMPKQVMTFSNGGLASFIPRQTSIMGQPHSLAYINPREEQILQDYRGNAPVLSGPAGVPSYWSWAESSLNPKNWGGGGNSSAAASNEDSSSSAMTNQDRINEIYKSSDNPWETHGAELNDLVADRGGTYSGGGNGDSGGTQTDDDSPAQDVGLLNSLLMGTGFKKKTPEYYSATADTLARQYGPERAQTYINEMRDKGNITTDLANALMESTTITGEDYIRRGLITDDMFITNPTYVQMLEQAGGVSSSDDGGSGSDQTGDDQTDGEEGDGEEEEAGPPSSMNFRFFGGYSPVSRSDVLVPSSFQQDITTPDARLDPMFPQRPEPVYELHDDVVSGGFDYGDGGFTPGLISGPGTVDPGLEKYGPEGPPDAQPLPKEFLDDGRNYDNYLGFYDNQLAGQELLNDPNYRGDGTNFGMVMPQSFAEGVTPGPGMPGQGQFATMQELMEYQQKYPNVNLMGEYQRLKALEGGAAQPVTLPQRGVASLMGSDPATEAMYQGIMS